MLVTFKNVGRSKASWSQDIVPPTLQSILRAVTKKGCLMSSDVHIWFHPDNIHGEIIVGGFRRIGTFVLSQNLS